MTPGAAWPPGSRTARWARCWPRLTSGSARTRSGARPSSAAEIRGHVTGPGAAALLAGCQAAYAQASRSDGVSGGRPLGDVDVAEEAFRWVAYTPASAVIDLVSACPGSQGTTVRASTRLQVLWDRTDWVLVAPPGGSWPGSASVLSSLAGYTVFPGQG